MTYQELITGAGEALGIPGMIPDDAGDVTIADESFTIVIGHDAAQNRVVVHGLVCPVPENDGAGLYRMLLAANFAVEEMKGAALAVDEGSVYLCRSDRVEGLSVETFTGLLQDLADALAKFRAAVEAFVRLGDEVEDRKAELPAAEPEDESEMIIRG